jgi:hypothetical protein
MAYSDLLLYSNPTKKRKTTKKTSLKIPGVSGVKSWLQGIDLIDAAAATAGLAAATLLPGLVMKNAPTTPIAKAGKLALAVAAAGLAGMVFKGVNTSAGKAAVIGGLAGTASQALAMFTSIKIGAPAGRVGLPSPIAASRVGSSFPAPPAQNEFNGVRLA